MSRTPAFRWPVVAVAGLLCLLLLGACSGKRDSGPLTQGDTAQPEESSQTAPAPATQEPQAAAETPGSPAPAVTPAPAPKAKTETPPVSPAPNVSPGTPTPAPTQAPSDVGETAPSPPAGVVAVPATKPGLTRVGPEKCKLCHRLQYDSWAATAHAARKPPLECESCHGNGSEYKTLAIMKDIEKARAAGLVIPQKSFCTENCHATGWQDDMLQRAHAHKPGAAQG